MVLIEACDESEFESERELLDALDDFFDADTRQETQIVSNVEYKSVYLAQTIRDSINVLQNTTRGCGGKIWPAAELLCYHLSQRQKDLRDKYLLEIGSGTGVVGIWLAKLLVPTSNDSCGKLTSLSAIRDGPCVITMSDLDFLVPLMQENMTRNGYSCDDGWFNVVALPWGEPIPHLPQPDLQVPLKRVILISDCVYLEPLFEPLLYTLEQLITDPDTVCWMSYKRRRRAERIFFKKLNKLFNVRVVSDDSVYAQFQRDRLFLYEITPKHRSK